MTEIATAIGIEIETGTTITTEIAATTTTGSIGITTEMTDATWTGMGDMIAVITDTTTGAGTGVAGSTGTAATGFTKKLTLALSESQRRNAQHKAFRLLFLAASLMEERKAAFLPPSLVDVGFLLVADVSRSHQPSVNFNEDGAVAIH
jgi:hypothetical protein